MKIMLAAAALVAASSVASAQFTVYSNDFAGWAAAAGSYATETFTGNVINTGAFTIATGTGAINNDQFEDRLRSGETTTFTFGSAITAFGGNFDFNPGGPGIGLNLFANGVQVGSILNPSGTVAFNGFWGFTSTTAFDSVQLVGDGQPGNAETYNLDNVVFSAIPLPSAAGLGFVGLAGLAARRRAR